VAAGPSCNAAAATGYPTIAFIPGVYVVYASAGSPGEVRRGMPDSSAVKDRRILAGPELIFASKNGLLGLVFALFIKTRPTYEQPYFDICIKKIEK
jgi:hypothetical protein